MKRLMLLCAAFSLLACGLDEASGPTSAPVTITWRSCTDPSEAIRWFAVQDGTGPWRQVAGVSGTYQFQLNSHSAGVAYVAGGESPETVVRYYTTAELAAVGPRCYEVQRPKTRLTGSVSSLSASEYADIAFGDGYSYASPDFRGGVSTFSLDMETPKTSDLLAVRQARCAGSACPMATGMIIRRSLTIPADASLGLLDFSNVAEVFPLVARHLTILGTSTGVGVKVSGSFTTSSTGAAVPLTRISALMPSSSSSVATYYGVPDERLMSGDEHRLFLQSGTNSLLHEGMVILPRAIDTTVSLGVTLSSPAVATARHTGFATASATLPRDTGLEFWVARFEQSSIYVSVYVSAGYRASGDVRLEVPDFSGVQGWTATWGLGAGSKIFWSVSGLNVGPVKFETSTYSTMPSYRGTTRFGSVTP
jgi:hypothetical protein